MALLLTFSFPNPPHSASMPSLSWAERRTHPPMAYCICCCCFLLVGCMQQGSFRLTALIGRSFQAKLKCNSVWMSDENRLVFPSWPLWVIYCWPRYSSSSLSVSP